LVTGASSSPLQIDGWQALAQAGDLVKTSATPEYLGWHALRGAAHARYIGLAMPRMLARAPWLPPAGEAPDAGFRFTEDVAGAASDPVLWTNSDKHTWTNAAYAMAANIARAYSQHGWCARIRGVEGGGLVSDLPTAEMPADDGSLAQACGTEIALSDRREAELAKFGLMPLTHLKNREHAVFFSAKPLYLPGADSDGPLDSFQDALASSWPYLLTACSVMRVLKCMVRDKIGVLDDATLHQQLQAWLAGQVLGDAQASSPQQQAQRPLAAAALRFSAAPASGYLQAQLSLLPHYQLEGLGTPMQLTTLLPGMRSPA
jgi:type VI secretion system protein ImpC